ncbi:hypothetical protein BJ912DRAFT_140730 [Pholiota molesta]|nr:hypothetical protein BJ912DRAFT_140730 [Pholiota molesta]
MASPLGSEDELKKLTVPQLKLMCKERCITGYTKLPKAGVIGKLLDWRKKNFCPQSLSPGLTTTAPAQTSSADVLENGHSMVQAPDSTISVQRQSSSKALHSQEAVMPFSAPNTSIANSGTINIVALGNVSSAADSQQAQVSALSQGGPAHEKDALFLNKPIDPLKATSAPISSKRPQDKRDSGAERVAKKPRTLQKSCVHPLVSVVPQSSPFIPSTSTIIPRSEVNLTNPSFLQPSENYSLAGIHSKRNRFKPLVSVPELGKKIVVTPTPYIQNPSRQTYLDFGLEGLIPQLRLISLPPSVAQRKHVPDFLYF